MTINQTQDNEIAYEQFISSCDDFISILLFIAGDVHRKFRIKIGYPVYLKHPIKPDTLIDMPEYYLITTPLNNKITKIETNSISSNFRNLPLGSKLLSQDAHLFQLWNFYAKQELSDIEGRILRASIAVGKAIRSINFSESILYTCIALETLFIYNKDLQSRSTTSDMLGYIIKDNLNDDKVDYIKELAKNIYDNRSDIMHGRKVKNPQQDYMSVNVVLRNAIVNLLADEKYKNIKSAEELYHLYY